LFVRRAGNDEPAQIAAPERCAELPEHFEVGAGRRRDEKQQAHDGSIIWNRLADR
jgi:hypothetical protein